MNRRCWISYLFGGFVAGVSGGCARLGFSTGSSSGSSSSPSPAAKPAQPSFSSGSRRGGGTTGISDLKTLGKLLEQAKRPLTEAQINFLSTLKPGPEFTERMTEVLTDLQLDAIRTTGRRRR